MYTVKQVSELTGVSVRTLHYYDEIKLLTPSKVGANGYRYYDDQALLRLQQILFYREVGLELEQIKEVLDSPDFDLVAALRSHRTLLQEKIEHLQDLVNTVNSTISHLSGEVEMSNKQLFKPFTQKQEEHYTRLARLQYDPVIVDQSVKLWKSYSQEQKDKIFAEGSQVYIDLVEAMNAGKAPQSADVQAILQRWHQHLRYFYEPTLDILRGLGQLYNTDPAFMANFQKMHPDLPEYLQESITQYVDDLEYAEIERMIAEDEAKASKR